MQAYWGTPPEPHLLQHTAGGGPPCVRPPPDRGPPSPVIVPAAAHWQQHLLSRTLPAAFVYRGEGTPTPTSAFTSTSPAVEHQQSGPPPPSPTIGVHSTGHPGDSIGGGGGVDGSREIEGHKHGLTVAPKQKQRHRLSSPGVLEVHRPQSAPGGKAGTGGWVAGRRRSSADGVADGNLAAR